MIVIQAKIIANSPTVPGILKTPYILPYLFPDIHNLDQTKKMLNLKGFSPLHLAANTL